MKIDKSVIKLHERLNEIESTKVIEENAVIEARFTELRQERYNKTASHVNRTYEEIWASVTQEEKDYYKKKNLEIPPEQRYQIKKHHWYFHESSYSMRGLEAYDGYGCNGFTGCIPECRFYSKYGRIEDEEVLRRYE